MENDTQRRLDLTPVSVTLTKDDLQRLDRVAWRRQSNRSVLAREAIRLFLQGAAEDARPLAQED